MPRIMVVDDEVEILDLFVIHLNGNDKKVRTFSSAKDALQALKSEKWDVVISDINMPQIDGFTLIQEVQKIDKSLPCIMITAFGSDDNLRKVLENNCFGYVNKPFDWNYLNLLVDNAIRSRSGPHMRSG